MVLALYGGIGQATAGGLLLAASLALLGVGGAVSAIVGSWLLPNRGTRAGVEMLSIGLLGLAGFAIINSQTAYAAESVPAILVGGVGLLGLYGGVLLTAGSLIWQAARRWRHRPAA